MKRCDIFTDPIFDISVIKREEEREEERERKIKLFLKYAISDRSCAKQSESLFNYWKRNSKIKVTAAYKGLVRRKRFRKECLFLFSLVAC